MKLKKESLLSQFMALTLITAIIFFSFRYLLSLIFPFFLAYALMRLLYPAMNFLHKKCHWPKLFSHYGLLFTFFALFLLTLFFFLWQIYSQLRLFFVNIPVYFQILSNTLSDTINNLCHYADYYLHLSAGSTSCFLHEQFLECQTHYSNFLTKYAGKTLISCFQCSTRVCIFLLIVSISMIILVKEMHSINTSYRNSSFYDPVHNVLLKIKQSGIAYLRTESIILFVNWILCSIGLFLINNPYFFLLGMFIAIFDAFPVLGSGLIFVPWSIYAFCDKEYYYAAILITTYLITLFVREYLEAKLLGNGMGFNPFFVLVSIFTGIKIFGVSGILLGPLSVVCIRAIYQLWKENTVAK